MVCPNSARAKSRESEFYKVFNKNNAPTGQKGKKYMAKSIHNPEPDAPIDTIVEGVQYIIDGGDTLHGVNDKHAKNLLERYGFLQVVEAEKAPATPEEVKASRKAKPTAPAPVEEAEEDGEEEEKPAPKKPAKNKVQSNKKRI